MKAHKGENEKLVLEIIASLGGKEVPCKKIIAKLREKEKGKWRQNTPYVCLTNLLKKGLIRRDKSRCYSLADTVAEPQTSGIDVLYLTENENSAFEKLANEIREVPIGGGCRAYRLVNLEEKVLNFFEGNTVKCQDFIAKLIRRGLIEISHKTPQNGDSHDLELHTYNVDVEKFLKTIDEIRIIPSYPFEKEIPKILRALRKEIDEKQARLEKTTQQKVELEKSIRELTNSLDGDKKLLEIFDSFKELSSEQINQVAEIFRQISAKA
jgi:hypothetical protein